MGWRGAGQRAGGGVRSGSEDSACWSGEDELLSPPLPNLRSAGFGRPASVAHASSRLVSRRSGGGRPRPIATDHQPLTSCRQRADQATAHARAVPGHAAGRFRADDGKDGMHSRAAACKAAQFTWVHQCSHSAIVGHMEDAFVSSEIMCVNRGDSHTV